MRSSTDQGEIVEVEGGHIVRSTGRKDRHSKVYTSKGPRDRRVRLSAHTAIEFYDVQDRLGYDRPSKAVDWLIKKAKPSIDKLAELPPWHPFAETQTTKAQEEEQNAGFGEPSENSGGYNFHFLRQLGENQGNFISPPNVDTSDHPIAFFPTTTSSTSSSINFQSYPTEDLGLSLHSFQDHTGLIPWQTQVQAGETENHAHQNNQTLFAAGFENHYQRMVTNWNNEATTDYINKVGFMVNSQSQQPFVGQGCSASEYSPSETLHQSSWNDIPMANSSSVHHRSQQASVFGSIFLSNGLAGFCNIPEEEDNGVASNRPSSASPRSHH